MSEIIGITPTGQILHTGNGCGGYCVCGQVTEEEARASSARAQLEYLRGEIEAERISQGEIIELQGLAEYIEDGDVQLLEWAGVPEFEDDETPHVGHRSHFTGAWYCDTCRSPYCDLA